MEDGIVFVENEEEAELYLRQNGTVFRLAREQEAAQARSWVKSSIDRNRNERTE